MMWSVAARFHFPEREMWGMKVRRLMYWYRGHAYCWDEEQKTQEATMARVMGGAK